MFFKNQITNDFKKQQNVTQNNVSKETNNKDSCINTSLTNCNISKNNLKIKNKAEKTKKVNSVFSFSSEIPTTYNFEELVMGSLDNVEKTIPPKSVSNIKEHSCGNMDVKCPFCSALHFKGEANDDGLFKSCCNFGKVKLQRTKNYPKKLQELFTGNTSQAKNFKENIRSFNSANAFASMGAKIEPLGSGPYVFKIQGQVYHNTYNIENLDSESAPKYSQLYVLDSDLAVENRLAHKSNSKCDPEVMKIVDKEIRSVNSYAESFKNLAEVVKEQEDAGKEVKDISLVFNDNVVRDQRRYNAPKASEIAMVFSDPNGEPPFNRDIIVHKKGGDRDNVRLNILSPHLDPMTYPLLYPHANQGWKPDLELKSYHKKMEKISLAKFKTAQMSVKKDVFNPILHAGKLSQQWYVDAYTQVEANNLNFIKFNQKKLRVDLYKGLIDYLNNGTSNTSRPIILPSSFQGSQRNMRERYHDAMAIVRKYGKPDIFLTMTCNPNWDEIKNNIEEGQSATDRADIVAKVFDIKLNSLLDEIKSGKVFGEVKAHVYSVEFQKRGLPHAHILIFLKDKITDVSKIDKFVSSEIPSPEENEVLHQRVLKHMIHGPCGPNYTNSPCMDNGVCKKNFPKDFCEETIINSDGYPQYMRRKGVEYEVRGSMINNDNVIPFNKYLLERYNCHINVEICTSVKSVKYIFKYIYKGYDCATLKLTDNNEIEQYLNSRYVSAPEACWRLFKHKMHGRSHKIHGLPVHLPQEQMIIYAEGAEADAVRNSDLRSTSLLAYFKLNTVDPNARKYYYSEIPYHYTYKKDVGVWTKRKNNYEKIITRLFSVSPAEKERFSLRILLLNVKGSRSFEELRSFNGVVYQTFFEAVEARGLFFDDKEWDRTIEEAVVTQSPSSIRSLFGYICAFNKPNRADILFEKYYEDMSEDLKDFDNAKDRVLSIIADLVAGAGWTLRRLGLPEPTKYIKASEDVYADEDVDVNEMIDSLNFGQKAAFNKIISSTDKLGQLLFLDGPAGTGKTYLYNVISAYLEKQGKSVIQMATTGIAADLLKNGRTMHSTMKLPVPLTETSVSRLQKDSPEAERIMRASLLIIDEVSMMSKHALNAIDEVLKRLSGKSKIFGGKTLLLGGDFRQTANIVLKGRPVDIIENSIVSSNLWRLVKILRLSENMRSINQPDFNSWLLDIGNGRLANYNSEIEIPEELIESDLIESAIFGTDKIKANDKSIFDKVILTTTNEAANLLNRSVLSMVDGDSITYISADSIVTEDINEHINFPLEFLNAQQPSGMPPHKLELKVGAVVMLLRNLDPKSGLLNGTRIWVKDLKNNFIIGEIISGRRMGKLAVIPRIDMMPSETILPFVLKRRQFPVILSYAMTIHKAQGQSFKQVGVYIPDGVFAHGQLYVAVSRCRNKENLKIKLGSTDARKTKNVVFPEILKGNKMKF